MRMGYLFTHIDERSMTGHERLLSITKVNGVVPRDSITDKPARAESLIGYKLCHLNDLVVNQMSVYDGLLGVSPIDGLITYHYLVFRPQQDVDPRFYSYLLRTELYKGDFSQRVRGLGDFSQANVRTPHIRISDFLKTVVPVPPIEEQRRIAEFLDDQVGRIDQAIELVKSQMSRVIEVRDQTIAEALTGRRAVCLGGPPWFTHIPTSWVLTPLRARWQVIDCKHRTPNYVDEGIPVISPGDISPGPLDVARAGRFVNLEDYADLADELRRCRMGDLVYSRNASAGTAAIVTSDSPFTMGQDVCRITSSDEDQRYLMYWLNTLSAPQLDSVRVGSTFTRINVDQIKAFKIPAPPVAEQRTIASECDRVWTMASSQSEAHDRQSALLQERKRSLITAAVTGELDVSTVRPPTGPWLSGGLTASVESPGYTAGLVL
jgi:type I restriction enzyme S subunit